jgi:hypothetical protein
MRCAIVDYPVRLPSNTPATRQRGSKGRTMLNLGFGGNSIAKATELFDRFIPDGLAAEGTSVLIDSPNQRIQNNLWSGRRSDLGKSTYQARASRDIGIEWYATMPAMTHSGVTNASKTLAAPSRISSPVKRRRGQNRAGRR